MKVTEIEEGGYNKVVKGLIMGMTVQKRGLLWDVITVNRHFLLRLRLCNSKNF